VKALAAIALTVATLTGAARLAETVQAETAGLVYAGAPTTEMSP